MPFLTGAELEAYQLKRKQEGEEYMAMLRKWLPVVGVLAQIKSEDEAATPCTDERMCVPCYTGQEVCESNHTKEQSNG